MNIMKGKTLVGNILMEGSKQDIKAGKQKYKAYFISNPLQGGRTYLGQFDSKDLARKAIYRKAN